MTRSSFSSATRLALLLSLLAVAANADPDTARRVPVGLPAFPVTLKRYKGPIPSNKFHIVRSGWVHAVPTSETGPWEVDVLECEVLDRYWSTKRGEVTYLASTTVPLDVPASADQYEINGYIYPRDGQPQQPNGESSQCYNDAASYWDKPYMATARKTFTLPSGVTRFMVNNHPFQSDVYNLVRFRTAPDDCVSGSGIFFIPKDGTTSAAGARPMCANLGGTLADVTFKNIAEINKLARTCQGSTKKFHVAGWNGYDYGLGSMVFTSSPTSEGTGAVTIPDSGSYSAVCFRVKDEVSRIALDDDGVLFTSSKLMDYNQGKALCQAENRDLLHLNAPDDTLSEQDRKLTPWFRARALLFTTVGPFSSAYIGGFNGDPFAGSCIAFFNGANTADELGAVSVPPGGCEASKTNGVFCGPVRAGEPVRRSEL